MNKDILKKHIQKFIVEGDVGSENNLMKPPAKSGCILSCEEEVEKGIFIT